MGAANWIEVTLGAQAVFAANALVTPVMWLPPERITVGETVEVGYVVDIADGWATLLRERDRTVIRVRDDGIVSREVCRLGGQGIGPTLPQLVDQLLGRDEPVSVPACT